VNPIPKERPLNVKTLTTLFVLAATVATAPAAARVDHDPKRIVVEIPRVDFGGEPGCLFVLTFPLLSRDGAHVGDGTGCITSIAASECPDGVVAGCRETVLSTVTFDFADRGSITAPSTFEEVWLSDSTVAFRSRGRIVGGTGEFAGAGGKLKGSGTIDFATLEADARYVVRLKDEHGDDD
jgi:hypothetical protein